MGVAVIENASTLASSDATPVEHPRVTRGAVVGVIAGNALEFYDFSTYSFFSLYIAAAYFPSEDKSASLLMSLAVFGVGFFTRPIGAILIGSFADRVGRKPAMMMTIALVTIGTMGLALTPSYASIGITAPVIVIVSRLIQGLALGGEVGPASAFLLEIAPPEKRGLFLSWQGASQGLANMTAGLIGLFFATVLAKEAMESWGWRAVFAFGLLLVPIGLCLRKRMPETLEKQTDQNGPPATLATQFELLRGCRREILLSTVLIVGAAVPLQIAMLMTTYAMSVLKMPPWIGMVTTIVVGASLFVFGLIGGWLADRLGRKLLAAVPRMILLVIIYPAFLLLLASKNIWALLSVSALLVGLLSLSGTAMVCLMMEALRQRVRALGFSIAYGLGVTLFGGTTQFATSLLIRWTGNEAAPAFYIIVVSIATLLAVAALPETRGRHLER